MRDLVKEDQHHDQRDAAENDGAAHAERADGRYREERSHDESAVAAHGKNAQARALGGSGNLVGVARALRMEQRRADAADDHCRENGPVVLQKADGRQSPSGQKHTQRNEPGFGYPVGKIAEHGLDDRREAGKREHQPCRGLIGEAVAGDQKRQNGR